MAAVSESARPPTRITGLLAALLLLGIVMFALPPTSRLAVAAVVVAMALFVKGGDAANIINSARKRLFGGD